MPKRNQWASLAIKRSHSQNQRSEIAAHSSKKMENFQVVAGAAGLQGNQPAIAPPNGIPFPNLTGSGSDEFTWNGIEFSAIEVNAGEDISTKIMSFCQDGPRDVCILAACGAVSHVTIQHPMVSELETYEGHFWILSLSGLFLLPKREDPTSRMGCVSISMSGPDGRVLGGRIAGNLTAAMPVLILVGVLNAI